MQHEINNKLNLTQVGMLKDLVGKTLNSIFVDEAGEFALSIVLDVEDKYIILKNIPSLQSDEDEYPCLVVERTNVNVKDYKQIDIGQNINKINIIGDKASWQYNNNKWFVESDIAIKICMKELELLLIAYDSLAGFLKIISTKELLSNNVFEEYWSMKSEKLDFLQRNEMSI